MQNQTTAVEEKAIEIWKEAATRDTQIFTVARVEALKEIRQWIADLPAAKLRRLPEKQISKEVLSKLRTKSQFLYENAVGIDLYNIYVQMFLGNPTEKKKEKLAGDLVAFFVQYSSGPAIQWHVGVGNLLNLKKMTEEEMKVLAKQVQDKHMGILNAQIKRLIECLYKELGEYARLFRKALSAKLPTEAELGTIGYWVKESLWLTYDESTGMITEMPSMGIQAIFSGAYRFIQRLWNGEISVGICAAPKCQRAFLVTPGGKPQLYCGQACRMRAYRYRKREIAKVATQPSIF